MGRQCGGWSVSERYPLQRLQPFDNQIRGATRNLIWQPEKQQVIQEKQQVIQNYLAKKERHAQMQNNLAI